MQQEIFSHIFTVTELNEMIDTWLSAQIICVQGEVSDFRINQNKFVYFDLKDKNSKISCFLMFWNLRAPLENGMEVRLNGKPGVWIPGGKLTFRVESITPIGEGALKRAFELTKQKLMDEGLFEPQYKQPLPPFPETIGLVTSPDAAAFSDVTRVLKNRWAGLSIFLKPAIVQGALAVDSLIAALRYFNEKYPVDLIILTRGGGSLEDLAAFNSEALCRAIFASKIPVVAGIGHERDETLAEYVADLRAATPSNAAEIAVPDKQEWQKKLVALQSSMEKLLRGQRDKALFMIEQEVFQIKNTLGILLSNKTIIFQQLERLLLSLNPQKILPQLQEKLTRLSQRLNYTARQNLLHQTQGIQNICQLLQSLNPSAPLQRGYTLSFLNGKLLRSVNQAPLHGEMETRLSDGSIHSRIESIHQKWEATSSRP